jgi:hypothetical protein
MVMVTPSPSDARIAEPLPPCVDAAGKRYWERGQMTPAAPRTADFDGFRAPKSVSPVQFSECLARLNRRRTDVPR